VMHERGIVFLNINLVRRPRPHKFDRSAAVGIMLVQFSATPASG